MRLDDKWQASLIVALGLFMAILDNTIVSVTLPQMMKAFHTDFETITWVVTGYFLAQAAVIPIVGYMLLLIVCAVFAALALFVGRDPAIEAAKRAEECEEQVEERILVMSK